MSCLSDLSEISGFSGISGISHSSTYRSVDSRIYDSVPTKIGVLRRLNHSEKLLKSLSLWEDSFSNYTKTRLPHNSLHEIPTRYAETLSKETLDKIGTLLTFYRLKQYMKLPRPSKVLDEEANLLGVLDLPEVEFDYQEKLDIKCCVETILRDKIHSFILKYKECEGNLKEILKTDESLARKVLTKNCEEDSLSWRSKIEETCTHYGTDLTKTRKLLEHWKELKHENMSLLNLRRAENLSIEAKVAEVQAKISTLSCTQRMFKETPVTITAFSRLKSIMNEKLIENREDIQRKKDSLKLYEEVNDSEYKEISDRYHQLCIAIERKRKVLKKM